MERWVRRGARDANGRWRWCSLLGASWRICLHWAHPRKEKVPFIFSMAKQTAMNKSRFDRESDKSSVSDAYLRWCKQGRMLPRKKKKKRKSPHHIKPDKLNWCHGSQSAALTTAISHFSLALTTSPGALITACPQPQSGTFKTSQLLTLSTALPLDQTHLQVGSPVKKSPGE